MVTLGVKTKGAKKKGKIKVKQSDEERAMQERLAREAELELRQKLAQHHKKRLKADMLREMEYSKTNRYKIQNQWRKIMRLAKVESLRKDIEVLSQNHERDVDRMDAIIQMLDRDLEESEEQYQMALRAHLQNIDTLIDLQDSRLLALENEFENDLRTLEDEFNAEREEIIAQHKAEKQELTDIMSAVEADERDRESEAKQEHEQQREEIRNKNLEDINVLRITLESTIEELERHFEAAHLNYLQNTDQRTQDFKYLTTQDQNLSKEIEVMILKEARLRETLAQWKLKSRSNDKECTERNRALREEKDAISKHFQELKSRMNKFRNGESRRLSNLTQNAHEAKRSLDEKLKLAKKIIAQAELAKKLETQREKVLPFYHSRVGDDAEGAEVLAAAEDEEATAAREQLCVLMAGVTEDLKGGADPVEVDNTVQSMGVSENGGNVEEWDYLDRYYKKFNKVLLDKLAIERERDRLRKENSDLQTILKQYLDGISVSEEVMSGPNPLLVVNGRINLNSNPVRHDGRPPVVDAVQMVNTGRASTRPY
eukprot:g330.t1